VVEEGQRCCRTTRAPRHIGWKMEEGLLVAISSNLWSSMASHIISMKHQKQLGSSRDPIPNDLIRGGADNPVGVTDQHNQGPHPKKPPIAAHTRWKPPTLSFPSPLHAPPTPSRDASSDKPSRCRPSP
jgi:hypothetical protein